MASKKPRRVDDVDELLPDETAASHITRFFQSIGDDAGIAVSVYQVDPKDRIKRSFIFELENVQELSGPALMAEVLAKFGPGEYIAEGRDANNVIRFCPRFRVGPIKPARAEIPDPRPASPAPSSLPAELVAMMDRQTRLLEALLNRPAPSLRDQLEELKALREAIAPPAPASSELNLGKVLELVSGVFKLRDELTDGAAEAQSPLAILAHALKPALEKIVDRTLEQPALAAPAKPTATVTPATAGEEVVPAPTVMLKAYVADLMRFAEQGLAPPTAAERVLATLAAFPEPMVAAVVEWLNDEAVVDNLTAVDPRAAQHREWLEQVVDLVLEQMLEPDETPAPAAPAANGSRPAAPN